MADEMKYTQEEIKAIMDEELRKVKGNAGKELNMNEMEQVSGGTGMTIRLEGGEFSREAFDQMMMDSVTVHGMAAAICLFKSLTGTKSHFYEADLGAYGRSITDEGYMQKELKRYWHDREQGII